METTYEYQGKWRDNCVDETNGKDGVGIKNDQIINGELIITLTDDITINAGKLEEDKDMKREYIRFYYGDIDTLNEQKIDELGNNKLTSPVFSNFSNPYSLSDFLSTLLFNQTDYSQEYLSNPYTFVGDIYCLVFGGSTSYYHFIVLDDSCIVK